jgi:hypothetical protein
MYVDGLERSGNTFLGGAIGYTLGIQVYPLWSHRVETLKNRNTEYPFIVPLRNVLESIVSAKLYRDYTWENKIQTNERTGNPKELIDRYSEYIDYLIIDKDLFIAPFHEFTKDHNSVIDVIGKTYQCPIVARYTGAEIIKKIGENPKLDNAYTGNFPRQYAQEQSKVVELFLSEYKAQIDQMQACVDKLYSRYYDIKDKQVQQIVL